MIIARVRRYRPAHTGGQWPGLIGAAYPMTQTLSRSDTANAEDVGNIVSLEHVNTQVPDQSVATLFYIVGLGFTRDPYMNVGLTNMWINIGDQQFHLPTGKPQVLRGHTGLVVPD